MVEALGGDFNFGKKHVHKPMRFLHFFIIIFIFIDLNNILIVCFKPMKSMLQIKVKIETLYISYFLWFVFDLIYYLFQFIDWCRLLRVLFVW